VEEIDVEFHCSSYLLKRHSPYLSFQSDNVVVVMVVVVVEAGKRLMA
jgi:hypothetical protein